MRDMRIRFFTSVPWVAAWACMVLGCDPAEVAPSGSADTDRAVRLRTLPSPAGPGSGEPNLSLAGDTILMSWLEPATEGHALRFSRLIGDRWEEPRTVVSRTDLFVNWADFPSVIQLPGGELAAHWLQYSGPGTYSYDIWVSTSEDGGSTWSQPSRPHTDGTTTEHGFVSLFASHGADGLSAAWLDGRAYADTTAKQPFMSLRAASLGPSGEWKDQHVLDDRTCDCCQTSVARIGNGVIVAYRGRTKQEIRDIRVVRFAQGRWSQPMTVHNDAWEIPACPVNGPSIAARGDTVAVAWFTAADDIPRVRLAFSYDGGSTFAKPTNVATRGVLGRVSVSMLDGGAMVTYLAQFEAGAGVLTRYIMLPDGRGLAPLLLGESAAERSSGFPVAVRRGSDLVVAWTVPGEPRTIRIVAAHLFR